MFDLRKIRCLLLLALALCVPAMTLGQENAPQKKATPEKATPEKKTPQKPEAKTEKDADKKEQDEPKKTDYYYEVIVTATRTEKDTFDVPNPVSVIGEKQIEIIKPNTVTDLLRDLPGVDVNGVGPSQPRPIIRGQRGQRILILEDGIRLNNSRQTSDFGEIPGLIDVDGLLRVEVVRGPGSVLYGSDAIGGVINMITNRPAWTTEEYLSGELGYRYSSADQQSKANVKLSGHAGNFGWVIGGSYRDTSEYEAPSGTFGEIHLSDEVTVNGTDLRDESIYGRFEYRLSEGSYLFFKSERYRSHNAGFGWVDPSEFNSESGAIIDITYPFQNVDQYVFGYRGTNLGAGFADSFSATVYTRNNERELNLKVTIPFFPGAGMIVNQNSLTDVETLGTRVEATKAVTEAHVVTYGLDAFRDSADTATVSTTEFFGFPFPPSVDTTPSLPRADFTSYGVFVQDDWLITERLAAIIGIRGQGVNSKTKPTAGLDELDTIDSTESDVVWAANLIYELTDNFKLIGTVGTAFRSPNLTERFFHGPTPEGSGFQVRNPDLEPERSTNVDLGFKYRRDNVYCELTVFRNNIRDGIAILDITDPEPGSDPTFMNVNVDQLRYEGIELLFDWTFGRGFSTGFNYTHLDAENVDSPNIGVSDSFSDKYNLTFRFHQPRGRYWAEYHVRHNGIQDSFVIGGNNPVGDHFPAFTVHSVRAGFRLYNGERATHRLNLGIENLFNELYAEFSNAQFFRPQSKRSFLTAWTVSFN